MRGLIEVRSASAADLPDVAALSLAARSEASTPSQICSPDPVRVASQLGVLLSIDGGQILLARQGERLVGFMLARVILANIYNDNPVLFIEAIYVDAAFRRMGAGHALLSSAAGMAAEVGAGEVLSVPIPGARGVQRFLARMGFAPAATHRAVATSVLLRKLDDEASPVRRPTRSLEQLIARRRKDRIGTQSGPVDLRTFQEGLTSLEHGGPPGRITNPVEKADPVTIRTEIQEQVPAISEEAVEYPPRVP